MKRNVAKALERRLRVVKHVVRKLDASDLGRAGGGCLEEGCLDPYSKVIKPTNCY